MIRFQDIEGFLEAARLGSISKASETLHISHTALGKRIRSLESYYGVQLLKRTSSGVTPTEAGIHVINKVTDLLAQFESIHAELRIYREPSSYRIGVLPSLSASYLPERIQAMKKDGIETQVHIMQTSDELWENLKGGQIDGILAEMASVQEASFTKTLFNEPLVAVVYNEHPFGKAQTIPIHKLEGQKLILHPLGCGIRRWVEQTMREHGCTPNITSEVGFGGFIAGMVAAKAGITVLPESSALRLGEPGLITIPFEDPNAYRTIVFASSSRAFGNRLWPYFRPTRQPSACLSRKR